MKKTILILLALFLSIYLALAAETLNTEINKLSEKQFSLPPILSPALPVEGIIKTEDTKEIFYLKIHKNKLEKLNELQDPDIIATSRESVFLELIKVENIQQAKEILEKNRVTIEAKTIKGRLLKNILEKATDTEFSYTQEESFFTRIINFFKNLFNF